MKRKDRGFTLVELAIVMVIIGILIGGVLKGQEMLTTAKMKATWTQANAYMAARTHFQDKYHQLPGDMTTATQRIPGCGPNYNAAGNYCRNGNGNSIVGKSDPKAGQDQTNDKQPQYETVQFWKHLSLEGFITGINASSHPVEDLAWGQTHPASKWNGGFHVMHREHGSYATHWVRLQGNITGDVFDYPKGSRAISPNHASRFDYMFDDGLSGEGAVQSVDPDQSCDEKGNGAYFYKETQLNCTLIINIGL